MNNANRFVISLLLLAWFVFATTAQAQNAPDPAPVADPAPSVQLAPGPAPVVDPPTETATETPLPIQLKGSVEPATAYIGDPLTVTYRLTAEKPFSAKLSGNPDFGKLDLTDKAQHEGKTDQGLERAFSFTLIGFETGSVEIPAQTFALEMDGHKQTRKSLPLRVEVKSLLDEEGQKLALREMEKRKAEEAEAKKNNPTQAPRGSMGPTVNLPQDQMPQGAPPQGGQTMMIGPDGKPIPVNPQGAGEEPMKIQLDPRGDKPPVPLLREDYTLAYAAAALLSVLLLVAGVFLWRKFRPLPEETETVEVLPPPRPAHEIALERLRTLSERNLPAKRQWERFHTELSFIVREYLQNRYNLDALEMTSDEILRTVRGMYLRGVDERLFLDFFGACDLVKFARYEPDETRSKALFDQAALLVERTREDGIQ